MSDLSIETKQRNLELYWTILKIYFDKKGDTAENNLNIMYPPSPIFAGVPFFV